MDVAPLLPPAAAGQMPRPPEEPPLRPAAAAVAEYWRSFDLEGRRARLDELGLKVADYQEASAAARRRLTDATREFKRAPPAGVEDAVQARFSVIECSVAVRNATAVTAVGTHCCCCLPNGSALPSDVLCLRTQAAGALLRQYQEEVDALTRRSKHAESAFLGLYEALFEART
jgi:homeobox protein cut-like